MILPQNSENTSGSGVFAQEITRAKAGMDIFFQSYRNGPPEWKWILLNTYAGEAIQSMMLGVKPVYFFEGNDFRKNGYGVMDKTLSTGSRLMQDQLYGKYHVAGNFLYDSQQVLQVVQSNRDIFTDFDFSQEDPKDYLLRLQQGNVQDGHTKLGLLLGFPKEDVLSFARNFPAFQASVFYSLNHRDEYDSEEHVLIDAHYGILSENDRRIFPSGRDFLKAHKQELVAFLQRRFPWLTPEQLSHCVQREARDFYGFKYVSDREDNSFYTFVHGVYEASGMNMLVARLKNQ
ncbi:MAG TPA: hypothetical protein VFQ63_03600 [Patescibacteria group bacterium]|nr:hypothetical protein [Patescibacteria group bacterium]